MRVVLDENFPESLAGLFAALGYEAFAIRNSDWQSLSDQDVALRAATYDCLLTLDLHRDEPSWLAVHRALLTAGTKVVRIRLPKHVDDGEILKRHIVQSLTRRIGEWMRLLQEGACVVVISHLGADLRAQSPEDIQAMLARFAAGE